MKIVHCTSFLGSHKMSPVQYFILKISTWPQASQILTYHQREWSYFLLLDLSVPIGPQKGLLFWCVSKEFPELQATEHFLRVLFMETTLTRLQVRRQESSSQLRGQKVQYTYLQSGLSHKSSLPFPAWGIFFPLKWVRDAKSWNSSEWFSFRFLYSTFSVPSSILHLQCKCPCFILHTWLSTVSKICYFSRT